MGIVSLVLLFPLGGVMDRGLGQDTGDNYVQIPVNFVTFNYAQILLG